MGIVIPSVQESGNWPILRETLNVLTTILLDGKAVLRISFLIISYALALLFSFFYRHVIFSFQLCHSPNFLNVMISQNEAIHL